MKYLTILSLLPLFIFSQCTVEKRLYNPGFHVEWKQRSSKNVPSENRSTADASEEKLADESVQESILTDQQNSEKPVSDSTALIQQNNAVPADTVYYREVKKNKVWDKERKRSALIGVGIPALVIGVVAVSALSTATAAGAGFGTLIIFGIIGWFLALVAAILLIIFLVFLCIPPDYEKIEDTKIHQFNKGERTGLIVTFVFAAIVGLAFLITGLNQ